MPSRNDNHTQVQATEHIQLVSEAIRSIIHKDEVGNFKKSLERMFLDCVASDFDYIDEIRKDLVFHYEGLQHLLDVIESIQVHAIIDDAEQASESK